MEALFGVGGSWAKLREAGGTWRKLNLNLSGPTFNHYNERLYFFLHAMKVIEAFAGLILCPNDGNVLMTAQSLTSNQLCGCDDSCRIDQMLMNKSGVKLFPCI